MRRSFVKSLKSASSLENNINAETPDVIPKSFQSSFLQTMLERGFIHQCTDFKSLDEKLCKETVVAYLGFDATARSLHVGSLLQIMILRNLQKAGHKPIILIGGGTTKVGDPTGKDESRQLLTEEVIQSNADSIAKVFSKFIVFGEGPSDAIMVNNADWLDEIKYLDFLRDYGRFFTINRMLSFESVKIRLSREQPLSFLEFNYMLLQAYDFVELNRRYKASLQLGGSDQWGNIISGVELGRKTSQLQLFGLTAPLLTTSEGKKMGKTAEGAVWLDKELLPEYDYWQFWRNTADADVIRFLKLFTELPMERIQEMESWEGAKLNEAKVILADEATRLLHGEDCLAAIKTTASALYGNKSTGGGLDSLPRFVLSVEEKEALSTSTLPVVNIIVKCQLATSKAEARRLITGGGARVNDVKITDDVAVLSRQDFDSAGKLKLSSGKKKHVLVVLDE